MQAVQVLHGSTARVFGRPIGAVGAGTDGGVFVLLETDSGVAGGVTDQHDVRTVTPSHPVPEGGTCVAVVRLASGAPLAVYAVPVTVPPPVPTGQAFLDAYARPDLMSKDH